MLHKVFDAAAKFSTGNTDINGTLYIVSSTWCKEVKNRNCCVACSRCEPVVASLITKEASYWLGELRKGNPKARNWYHFLAIALRNKARVTAHKWLSTTDSPYDNNTESNPAIDSLVEGMTIEG